MKINKYIVLGILLTTFLIGLIATNIFSSDLNSKAESKDDNILKEVEKSPLSSDPFIPTPNPPCENLTWNFPNGTIKAFHWVMSTEGEGFFGTRYYNITSMPYVYNKSGTYMSKYEYCVEIQELYYNSTLNTLLLNPLNPEFAYVSLLNVTDFQTYFFPQNVSLNPGPNPFFLLNAFIPKNGSEGLALNWSASHLKLYYDILLGPGVVSLTVNEISKNIYYLNSETKYYVNLTYDALGILSIGKASFEVEGIQSDLLVIVDDNFNPVDEIEWNVEEGDELYYGIGPYEYKFNVTKIVNETHVIDGIGIVVVETVWANMSRWNEQGFIGWTPPFEIRIGSASEAYPLFMLVQPIIPVILPKNYDMKWIAEIYKFIAGNQWDQVTYEDTWVKLYNSTTQYYTTFEYNVSGLIELLDMKYLLEYFGLDNFGAYLKNSTEIDPGFHSFNLKPLGIKDFNVTLNISIVNSRTHLMYSAFDINPINITLNYGALFIDVWVNDSSRLDQTNFSPINITIKYDPSKYPNMRLYYINTSSNTPENSWLPVDFKNLGNGVIIFSVNYTGIFAFTNVPIPAFLLGDDDDDGEETVPAIPLGNYYLIFLLAGIIGIVLYTRRKLIFK